MTVMNKCLLEKLINNGTPDMYAAFAETIKQEKEYKDVKHDAITQENLKKPEVRRKANQLIKAIADSQSSTNGTGTNIE